MNINNFQADVTLSLDFNDGKGKVPVFGGAPFNGYSGGDLVAQSVKSRPGSMGSEVENGGLATRGDGTLTINWTDIVIAQFKAIENRSGKGLILISATWLDNEGVASLTGAVFGRTGRLLSISSPDYDGNGNAIGVCTIACGLDEIGT